MQQHNLSSVAIVDGAIKNLINHGREGSDGVEIREARNGYLEIGISQSTEGYLVISEVWHPGWWARLDGREVPLYRTNLALLGLPIPPGSHQLTLEFRPLRWKEGMTISILSGGVFALLMTGLLIRRSFFTPPTSQQ